MYKYNYVILFCTWINIVLIYPAIRINRSSKHASYALPNADNKFEGYIGRQQININLLILEKF